VVYHDAQGQVWPGIVQDVRENGSLDIAVLAGPSVQQRQAVPKGSGVNQWSWPPSATASTPLLGSNATAAVSAE
jgi:hypothetical protein